MKVAVYVRVSSYRPSEQAKVKSQDTAMQKHEIVAHLLSKGITEYEIYEDKGYSGTKDARPGLKRLMADCRAGQVKMVICWKLDRLFRSLRQLINTLEEFDKLKVEFVALKDSIDLTTHSGRLMMQMLGAFAEFESSIGKERTKAGQDYAVSMGKKLGRKAKPVNKEHVEALILAGVTHREIAESLGVSTKKIQRVLRGTH